MEEKEREEGKREGERKKGEGERERIYFVSFTSVTN